jgi:hypothetical protein
MKRRTLVTISLVAMSAFGSCADDQPDVPREARGIVVDSQTQQPIPWVKVSLEIKKKGPTENTSFLGHTRKAHWHTHVAETNEDGTFVFDFKTYADGADKIYKELTMSKITFEKDRYETLIKQPGEDWSRAEMKLTPAK